MKENSSLTPEPHLSAKPLVSVIVRTMGRDQLADALESIARQTYPNIEVVVVDARGSAALSLGESCGPFPLRVVSTGQPLLRPAAANAGLIAARGDFLTFLDEDDFSDPPHVAGLAEALVANPRFRAGYAGLRVYVGEKLDGILHLEYGRDLLLERNFLNPQSVMLCRSLLDMGCRFDESFEILEDWDFWIQISQHTELLRVDAVTGNWRASLGTSGAGAGANLDREKCAQTGARVKSKWAHVVSTRNAERERLFQQGLAFQERGDWAAAREACRHLLARNPYDANALNLSGLAELRFGRVDEAIEQLKKAAGLARTIPVFYYNLGLALEAANRIGLARSAYSRAVEIAADFAPARQKLLALSSGLDEAH